MPADRTGEDGAVAVKCGPPAHSAGGQLERFMYVHEIHECSRGALLGMGGGNRQLNSAFSG